MGNYEILKDGEWAPFFPFIVYEYNDRPDYSIYAKQGFNCVTTGWFESTDVFTKARAAGMYFFVEMGQYIDKKNSPDRYGNVADLKELLHEIVNARLILQTLTGQNISAYELKRHCIQQSIYGVDIDASAIDIARLRLWLSLIVDENIIEKLKPCQTWITKLCKATVWLKIMMASSYLMMILLISRMTSKQKLTAWKRSGNKFKPNFLTCIKLINCPLIGKSSWKNKTKPLPNR